MANAIFIYRYTESLHSQSRDAMNLNGNALHNVRLSPIHRLQEDSSVGSPIVLDPPPWRRARNSPCADTHFGVVREHLPFDGVNDLGHEPASLILIPGYFSIYLSRVQAVNFASCICIFH